MSHVAKANIVATCEVDLHASIVQQIPQVFSSCMRMHATGVLVLRFPVRRHALLLQQQLVLNVTATDMAPRSCMVPAAISMYTCMGGLYDGFAVVVMSMVSFEVLPIFDKPFLAESFSSFWQKRWNLCMGNTVRDLIYEPIQEGQSLHCIVPSVTCCRPYMQSRYSCTC